MLIYKVTAKYNSMKRRSCLFFLTILIGLFLSGCGTTEKDIINLIEEADALSESGSVDEAGKNYEKALELLPKLKNPSDRELEAPNKLVASIAGSTLSIDAKADLLFKTLSLYPNDKIFGSDSLIEAIRSVGGHNVSEKTSLFDLIVSAAKPDDINLVKVSLLDVTVVPQLAEYINPATLKQERRKPYIIGKILPIDSRNNCVDIDIYSGLPSELQANQLEEIGTIVLSSKQFRPVGVPPDGEPGRPDWTVRKKFQVADPDARLSKLPLQIKGLLTPAWLLMFRLIMSRRIFGYP